MGLMLIQFIMKGDYFRTIEKVNKAFADIEVNFVSL